VELRVEREQFVDGIFYPLLWCAALGGVPVSQRPHDPKCKGDLSSALEVLHWCGFGFVAGCAAVAMPRRQQQNYSRAMPLADER
jgi:hypothetical protein